MYSRFSNRLRRSSSRPIDMSDYKVQCDRSGIICNARDCVVEEHTGYLVRADFAESRHPNELFKVPSEQPANPLMRPPKYYYPKDTE